MKKGKMRMSGRRVLAFLLTAMMCMTLLPTNVFAAVMGTRYPNVRIVFSDGKTIPSSGYASGTSFTYDTLSGTTVKSPSSYYSIASNYTFSHYSCRDGGGMGTSSVSQPGDWWNPSGTIYMDIHVTESSTGGSSSGSGSSGGSTTSGSHSVNVNFRIVYLDNDEFNLGYNYGNTYSTTFNCQYSNCSTTNSYSNHCIALNDIGAAKNYMTNNGYVNSGWEIVGWGKDAKRNMSYSTTWTGTGYGSGGTTCQNNGYIEIVAKKKASYTIFINCYDQNNNLIYSTQENDKYAGDYYYVTAPSVSGYTKTGTTSYSGTMPNGNKTISFYYQSNVQNVTVTYMDRTMTYATETKAAGSQFTVKDCTNTRGSYVFVGWSETNGATTVDYEVGDGFVPTSDVTLYAVWQAKVKLTYNADNGTSATNTQEYAKGTNVTLKNANALGFTRSGYKFLGWNTSSGATTATYTAGSNLLLNSDATLYAVWQKIVYNYQLAYSYGIVNTEKVTNKPTTELAKEKSNATWTFTIPDKVPQTEGYTFTGWKANTDNKIYQPGETITVTGVVGQYKVVILTAQWAKPVTLTYNANGGDADSVPEPLTLMAGSTYRLSEQVPTRDGYVFAGWSSADQLDTASTLTIDYDRTLNEDTTVYARWSLPYIVNYDLNGGVYYKDPVPAGDLQSKRVNLLDTIKGEYDMRVYVYPSYSVKQEDGSYKSYPKWTKEGYTFLGWADTPEATEATYINDNYTASSVHLTAENPTKTVYAVWQANGPKLIETPFAIQLSFCYLENGRADIPDNFQLEMEITNENVPDFKLTKTLTKAEATETTNGGPALLWELNEKLPQSFENAAHHDAGQGSAELHGVNTVKIKAVNGEVSGYQFTMRGGGTDPTDARGGAQVRELTFAQAGSTYSHQHNFFNTYVIPHKATHYYYDSVDDYNKGNVGGTVVVESDGTSGKPHLETTQKAWNGITAEKKSYDGKSYIVKDKPESFAVTQATKNFEFKYIRKITVTWQKEDGSQIKSEEIPNGSDVSDDDYPTDQSTTGKWADPVKDENGNITIKWTEPKTYDYKMTYKLDGGKYNDNTADVVKEEKAQTAESYTFDALNPAPVKEGYIFKGWNGSLTVTKDSPNGEVTAVWEPKTYTVKWLDDDEKTVLDSDTFKTGENEPVYDEETPSKDDDDEYKYEFTGWSEPKKDTDGNITYVAQYTKTAIKKFTVTYTDGVDDEVIFEDDVHGNLKEGSATPKFTKTLSRDNYTFVDWSPSVAETVTENVTYVAQWKANTHKVTWVDENGDTIKEITVEDKDTTGVPEGETPTDYTIPEDKEFDKWEEQEPDENGDIVIKLILKDKVVEPPTPIEANYTVEWYEIGKEEPIKTETTRKGEVGTEVFVTDEDKTIEGYTFDEENSENVLSTELEESGTVLKLYFTKNQVNPPEPTETNYTVEWYEIGEDEPIKTDATRKGEVGAEVSVTDEDKTIKYYTFDEENENNVTSVELEESGTVLKLYFTANTHKVTWVDEDGTPVKEIEVKDKDTEGVPEGEEPTDYTIPDGKEFGGWGEPETDPETGDVTITVIWKDKEKTYTLSYDANEGTGAPAQQSETTTEDSVTFTVADGEPQREGYTFEGWTENLLARDSLYTAGNEITISEDTTLYAVWAKNAEPEKTHSVTWKDGYTDTPIKTLTDVKENEDITDKYPEEPKRDGYSFDGWNEPETDSEGNVTITAKWKEDNSDDNNNGGNNGGNNNRPTGGGGNSNRPGRTPAGTGITNGGGLTEILDENVPLADVPDLNNADHFAYIIGYEDGLVRPENNISRAEVATIFFRLMTDAYRSENWATSNNYSDVNVGQWFNNAVSTGTTAGILTGYEDGTFLPEQMITRAEFATMAVRFLSGDAAPIVSFNDIDGHWAADNILKAAAVGWINGYEDGSFRPDQPITRAETATLVNRMLNRDPKGGMLDDMVKWPDNPEDAWYYSAIQEATNGHDYVTGAEGETWTSMLANRDWSELEK